MGSRGQELNLDFAQQGVLLNAREDDNTTWASSSSSSASVALASGAVPSALDLSRVPTVSLHAALALHATGAPADDDSYARALSRKRTFWDVTELPTADSTGRGPSATKLPVLAPTGTLPPLAAPEKALFAAVSRADVAAVRRLLGLTGPATRRQLGGAEELARSADDDELTRPDKPASQAARRANILAVHPESGANVMHLAATAWGARADDECGRAWMLDCLAGQGGAGGLLDARAFNGSTPLHWAAGLGHLDAVRKRARCKVALCCPPPTPPTPFPPNIFPVFFLLSSPSRTVR
jgi:hypothetical protein